MGSILTRKISKNLNDPTSFSLNDLFENRSFHISVRGRGMWFIRIFDFQVLVKLLEHDEEVDHG